MNCFTPYLFHHSFLALLYCNISFVQQTKDCVAKTLKRLEEKICGQVSFVTLDSLFLLAVQ